VTQDPQKGVSNEWLSHARKHTQQLKRDWLRTQRGFNLMLQELEDEMTLVDFLTKEIGQ
jgi:hypothetical protein